MSSSSPSRYSLRARKSQLDTRVELIEATIEGDGTRSPLERTPSPSPRTRKRVKLAVDETESSLAGQNGENEEDEVIEVAPRKKSPTKNRPALDKALPAPKRWQECYDTILEQRKGIIAPVDSMVSVACKCFLRSSAENPLQGMRRRWETRR